MRALVLFIALICTVCTATAQTQSTLATVKVGSVLVRCGPSDQMAVCGTLEQGTEVIAHHPVGTDWYAIQPPSGSLSWISQINVELKREPGEAAGKFPVNAVVHPFENGEAKIAAGLMGEFKPLNVQRTKLPAGTIVTVTGPKVMIDGKDTNEGWYPITPPRDDFRYVPLASLELSSRGEKLTYTMKGSTEVKPISAETGTISAIPSASVTRSIPIVAGDGSSNTLWRDAEKAQAESNFVRAEELYLQLATASNKAGDVKLANACYERVHTVRELGRTTKTSSSGSLRPTDEPKSSPGLTVKPSAMDRNQIGDGILRTVRFEYQGKKVYALTSSKGEVRLYLIADGIELDRYIGKWLEIAGTVTYPKEFAGDGLLTGTRIDTVK